MIIKLYKLQKILIWIPFVNFFVFFVWAWNQIELLKGMKHSVVIGGGCITLITVILCGELLIQLFHLITPFPILMTLFYYYVQGIMLSGVCVLSQKIMVYLYDKYKRG